MLILSILENIRSFFDTELFTVSDTTVRVSSVLGVVFVLAVTFWLSRTLRKYTTRAFKYFGQSEAKAGTTKTIIHFVVLVVGFAVAFDTAGFDLTALFAAGAVFAIGLGFAMQSIAQNFVAGVILLSEQSIKPGDILEVEGTVVKVQEIGIRSSIARTWDGEELIVPNSTLIQTTVKNHTLYDTIHRIVIDVGVAYESDMKLVRETLEELAKTESERLNVPGYYPAVYMAAFGSSSVDWKIALWVNDPWTTLSVKSQVHEAIWRAFKEKGIVIAYPQLDVHLKRSSVTNEGPSTQVEAKAPDGSRSQSGVDSSD